MPYFGPNKTTMRYVPYPMPNYNPFRQLLPAGNRINTRTGYGQTMTMTDQRRKRRRVRNSFKNKVFNTMSAKHATGEQGLSMTHNTLYTLVPTALPTQGDTNASRDGDSIVLCALKLKGFWNSDTAASGYSYRVIVGFTGEEYTNTTFGSGLGLSELFLPNTGNNTSSLGQINAKAFTVLHDEKYTLNSQISGARDKLDYYIYVPLNNRVFQYQAGGSALGKTNNLVVVITGDIIAGASGTTPIGGTTVSWDFIYKNAN